ncbi:MAG: TIGR04423 family type III CRISPR-associated protein [Saprospiraceae bacterium]
MNNTISKISNPQAIPDLLYEGYLWYSNAEKPEILQGQSFSPNQLTKLPFVVEGMLYAAKENISIRIVNIDGAYRIAKMNLENIPKEYVTTYFAKEEQFGKNWKIQMYQHWVEKEDVINDNRLVFCPTWSAFVGFKNKEL